MTAQRTNEEWVAELSNGSDSETQALAIEALRKRLQRGIYYYLSSERSDLSQYSTEDLEQMAQDFTQDTILRVLKSLDTFRGDSQFTTWAMKIGARVAVSELRRARYRDFSLENLSAEGDILLDLSQDGPGSARAISPENATEREDVAAIIKRAFEEVLTERQRKAIEAVALQGIPMDVIAQELGTNRNALYKLLHDARKKLKRYLEDEGLQIDYVMNVFSR